MGTPQWVCMGIDQALLLVVSIDGVFHISNMGVDTKEVTRLQRQVAMFYCMTLNLGNNVS